MCCNSAINVDLRTRGEQARCWLTSFPAPYLGEAHDEGGNVFRYWDQPEFATPADPTLAITLTARGDVDEAVARCGGRELALSNVRPVHIPRVSDGRVLMRRATADETLELACRWFLKWDRVGCAGLLDTIFFVDRMAVAAMVVDDPIRFAHTAEVKSTRPWRGMTALMMGIGFGDGRRIIGKLDALTVGGVGHGGLHFPEADDLARPRVLVGAVVEVARVRSRYDWLSAGLGFSTC